MKPKSPMRQIVRPVCSVVLLACGCGSNIGVTEFTNPQFDFGYIETVAVLPLENMSNDDQAGERVARLIATELLASGAVDVVEMGEVLAAMDRMRGVVRSALSSEQIVSLGQALGAQGVMYGTVAQSEVLRMGTNSIPVVTLDLHLLETETAAPVWAATYSEKGSDVSAKLLGTGGTPLSVTTRKCVREILRTLIG